MAKKKKPVARSTPTKKARFQQGGSSDKADATGSVTINLSLRDKGKYRVGNLTRSFTVKNATVSSVANAIAESLF